MILSEIGPLLGSGKEAEVFAYGDLVIKLYREGRPKTSAFREAAILAMIERLGVEAPRVQWAGEVDGRWGLTMTRVEGDAFAQSLIITPPSEPHLMALATLHHRLHEQSAPQLPSLKSRLAANIEATDLLDAGRRARLLGELATLPDEGRLCHGDFHPWNVLGTPEHATIVDWLDATSGSPAADVCRSYVLISQVSEPLGRSYVESYSNISRLDLFDVWRWLPVVAAARLAERIPHETSRLLSLIDG